MKEDLVQWVSHGLRKALSKENIRRGFEVIGIFPLNVDAMKSKMGPSEVYGRRRGKEHANTEDNPTIVEEQESQRWDIKEILEDFPVGTA